MSLYSNYKTDKSLENDGQTFNFGDFKATLRRVGGSNRRYQAAFKKAMAPYSAPGSFDKEDREVQHEILVKLFVQCSYIEHSWESKVEGEWVKGIENSTGDVVPGTSGNVLKVLMDLPTVYENMWEVAHKAEYFLESKIKETSENLVEDSSGN